MSRLLFSILLVLVPLAGCSRERPAETGPLPPAQERTTLRVENRSFMDMNVYAIRGNQRVRLGTVSGAQTNTFTIPPNLIFGGTPLRFLADPVGGRASPVSQEITVRAGDEVTLLIPPR